MMYAELFFPIDPELEVILGVWEFALYFIAGTVYDNIMSNFPYTLKITLFSRKIRYNITADVTFIYSCLGSNRNDSQSLANNLCEYWLTIWLSLLCHNTNNYKISWLPKYWPKFSDNVLCYFGALLSLYSIIYTIFQLQMSCSSSDETYEETYTSSKDQRVSTLLVFHTISQFAHLEVSHSLRNRRVKSNFLIPLKCCLYEFCLRIFFFFFSNSLHPEKLRMLNPFTSTNKSNGRWRIVQGLIAQHSRSLVLGRKFFDLDDRLKINRINHKNSRPNTPMRSHPHQLRDWVRLTDLLLLWQIWHLNCDRRVRIEITMCWNINV